MQKAIVRRTFDVVRNQRQEPIYAAKGDYGARYIQAIITADGVPYAIPENAVVTINAFRRDGKTNRFKGEVNADGSVIVPITQWMLEILGMVDCTISAVEEGGMLTTENFYVVANESSTNVEVSPDDPQYDLLTEVLLNEGTRQKQFSDMVEYINSLEQGKQGPAGPAGIHIGPEAPTDGQVAWIDTNEEPSAEEGGVNFDVVAKPGQVIAVKAVDVEGKPKEYKAVDLPVHDAPDWNAAEGAAGHIKNRTHYVDEKGVVHKLNNKYIDADWMATKKDGGAGKTVIIPEQTVTNSWGNLKADLVEGDTYAVEVNGVLYKCKCLNDGDGTLYLGNGTLLGATEGNSEPFAIAWLTGTGGMFYSDGTLETPIGIKVSDWVDDAYNTLPKEYMPEISWNELTDKPFIDGAGEPFFTHTATFASDAAAKNGVKLTGVSPSSYRDKIYWLEVNGELLKCHWESVTFGSELYDEDGNAWVTMNIAGVFVSAQTAGTYTYTLYAPSDELMLEPQYLPPNVAKKSDIPAGGTGGGADIDVTAEVGQTIIVKEVDANGKPTKWESADYQPRTHWCDETIGDLVPYTVFTPVLNEQLQMFVYPLPVFDFEAGKNYTVIFDGVEYVGTASAGTFNGIPFISVGNTYLHGAQSEEPFIVISIPAMNMLSVVCFSSDEHVIRVVGEKTVYHKIPSDFLKYVCHITRSISGDSDYCEFFTDWEELREAVKSGRQVVAEYSSQEGDMDFYFTTFRLEHAELGIVDSEQGWTDILFFANKASYGMFSEISVYRHADGTVEAKVSG